MMWLRKCIVLFFCVHHLYADNQTQTNFTIWKDNQLIPAANISDSALNPKKGSVREKIVLYHNQFRSKVKPSATNMLLMQWNNVAARQAQKYAEECIFLTHNKMSQRVVPRFGECGQNLYASSAKSTWFRAIKAWYLEYKLFTYGSPKIDLHKIGHYTQMVWATSHQVGCGMARCSGGPWKIFYNYVCHYCPMGNIQGIIQYPYKSGVSCQDCKDSCVAGNLCTNSCPVFDVYNNCGDLAKVHHNFCKGGGIVSGCNATCTCGDKKIYRNHPWS